MPNWLMRAYSVLVGLLGVALGLAANHGQFGWWSQGLVPVALVVAGSFGVMASATIRNLEQRVRALEQRQRAADAQLVPVSVRTDPPFLPPPSSDIQSGQSEARN
jgi:hypothetical protein